MGVYDDKREALKDIDLLKNSKLPQGKFISDPLKFNNNTEKVNRGIFLPRPTLEAYYQLILDGTLDADYEEVPFDEITPILFHSLREMNKSF